MALSTATLLKSARKCNSTTQRNSRERLGLGGPVSPLAHPRAGNQFAREINASPHCLLRDLCSTDVQCCQAAVVPVPHFSHTETPSLHFEGLRQDSVRCVACCGLSVIQDSATSALRCRSQRIVTRSTSYASFL